MNVTGLQPSEMGMGACKLGLAYFLLCARHRACSLTQVISLSLQNSPMRCPHVTVGAMPSESLEGFLKVVQVERRVLYVPGAVLSSLHLLLYFTDSVTHILTSLKSGSL